MEVKLFETKRKESISYNSSKSSSYSPPTSAHLVSKNFSESNESLASEDSSQRVKTEAVAMPSDTLNDVTACNDAAAAAAANEAAQQRRNKKRKPPNYYQSAEYAAILKTTDESAQLNNNSTSNTSKNEITNNHEPMNQISETNHTSETTNHENHNDAIVDCAPSSASTSPLPDNDPKTVTNSQVANEEPPTTKQNGNIEQEIQNLNLESTNNESNEKVESKLEETISNPTQTPTTTTTSNESSNNNSQINKPVASNSSKCWSSLFKSSTVSSVPVTATQVSSTNSTASSSNSIHRKNSKATLGSSMSLPISASSSSMSSSSSTSSSNHVHLNGSANNNNNHSATSEQQSSSSSVDVLRLLGSMFKQCELKHSAPALQPRGIRNKQNWCYVNAVIFSFCFIIIASFR